MIAVVLIFILLLVCAWAAYQFLPYPIGLVGALIIGILALLYLVRAVA